MWLKKMRTSWRQPQNNEDFSLHLRLVPKQASWYRPKGRRNPNRPCRRWNSQKPEQAIGKILESEKKLAFYFTIQDLMSRTVWD
jgi:hypothetical protein